MIEDHPLFVQPPHETVIWRYTDFTKLLSLLDKRALHFSRADQLADPFEGAIPRMELGQYGGQLIPIIHAYRTEAGWKSKPTDTNHARYLRGTVYLNCWFSGETESAALWKVFLKSDEGCAIRTTFGRLRDSLNTQADYKVMLGRVHYIDYERDKFAAGKAEDVNLLKPFVHKRKSFAHECEIRAAIWNNHKHDESMFDLDSYPRGLMVSTDPSALIEAIHVAPTAEDWFVDLVKSVVTGKYGLSVLVHRSELDKDPIY